MVARKTRRIARKNASLHKSTSLRIPSRRGADPTGHQPLAENWHGEQSHLCYTMTKRAYVVSIGGGMIRRLFKTGNSIVISLPKEVLDDLGMKDGERVQLELDREQRRVIITPIEKPIAIAGVNEEFARQIDEFIQQYRPALEELAK
jgi:antitoxin component of MazEF toxin-antitoxin module